MGTHMGMPIYQYNAMCHRIATLETANESLKKEKKENEMSFETTLGKFYEKTLISANARIEHLNGVVEGLKEHVKELEKTLEDKTYRIENQEEHIYRLRREGEILLQENKFIREGNAILVSENCEAKDTIDGLMNDNEKLKNDSFVRTNPSFEWSQSSYTVTHGNWDIAPYLVQKENKKLKERVSELEDQVDKAKETYDKLHQEKEVLTEAVVSLLETITGEEISDIGIVKK